MSEKGKVATSELGVQPLTLLRARAEKTLTNGAELDNVGAGELQGWLKAYFKDRIQPMYEDARHHAVLRILESAKSSQLVEPEVELWFSGYIPSEGQGAWHPGIMKTVVSLNEVHDSHKLAQFELDQKRAELECGAVADEQYFRNELVGIFDRAGASIYIQPYDLISDVPEKFKPTQTIVRTPGGFAISRGKIVAYRAKSLEYLDEYRTNINGDEQPIAANNAFALCANLMAHTEILHEYGIVIKNIGEQVLVDPLISQQNETIEL